MIREKDARSTSKRILRGRSSVCERLGRDDCVGGRQSCQAVQQWWRLIEGGSNGIVDMDVATWGADSSCPPACSCPPAETLEAVMLLRDLRYFAEPMTLHCGASS